MKKRMLPLLLALCMVFALLPGSVFAADVVASGSCGDDATWTLDSDGVLTVSGTGIMSEPTGLPSSPTVRSAIISEGITGIGNSAFASYSSMVSVSLPDSLTSIGENAFDRCVKLSGIEIPDGVTDPNKSGSDKHVANSDVTETVTRHITFHDPTHENSTSVQDRHVDQTVTLKRGFTYDTVTNAVTKYSSCSSC